MASASDVAPSRRLGNLAMVFRHARNYPLQITAAFSALAVTSGATIAIPYSFKRVIDRGFAGNGASAESVASSFHYMLMIVVVLALGTAVRFYFVAWLGERVVADIRTEVQRHLMTLSPSFYETNRPSEIASRLTADTGQIETVVGSTVSIALRNSFTAIGGLIYLFAISPKLAAMLLAGIPLIIAPIALLGRRVRNLSRTSQDRIADVGSIVVETLGAMKIVQAFGQEARESARFTDAVEATMAIARKRVALRAIMTAIVIGLIFGAITLVLWEGADDVAAGRLSGGAIAAFVLTGGIVAGAFGALTEVYGDLLRGAGAAGRLSELLAERPEIAPPAHPVALPQPPQGSVAFRNVEFRYPSRPDVAALHDFTLEVAPGETLAVVGPSGAGKSTLFQLLQHFYQPAHGAVLVDGVDLTCADPAAVRARIAMVPQETVIFGTSARDNLRYGRWDADDAQIWAAAEAANAADFLRALPDGLDTFLGEGGARLSGGQRQRVGIARALATRPDVLLCDEATSALDPETTRSVLALLGELNRELGLTIVLITHEMSVVRAVCSHIAVLDRGRVVDSGPVDVVLDGDHAATRALLGAAA